MLKLLKGQLVYIVHWGDIGEPILYFVLIKEQDENVSTRKLYTPPLRIEYR